MSSRTNVDFSWFYDSEQHQHASTNDSSCAEITRRPWKAYWPPKSDDNLDFWLRSEFPEVLSWRFDPNQPFDQPWRDWLRSLLMKTEAGSCRKKFNPKTATQAELSDSCVDSDLLSSSSTYTLNATPTSCKAQIATITYLAPLDLYKTQKPYFSQLPCGTLLPRTNLVESDHLVNIYDISGEEDKFRLDETGFEFIHLPTNISNWTEENVQSVYLPTISAWLKEYFKCEWVFVYNYNVQRDGTWRSPIFRAHCDNTPESCAKRLEFQCPTDAPAIKSGRYRYIDVWRSVGGVNVDAPLAVCDYRSIDPSDLHRIDIVYPHFSEEGFEVTHNPAHQWYYKKDLSKDDIVLFKIDDNLKSAARCKSKSQALSVMKLTLLVAPHAAFIDPSASGDIKRASIEIRAIVVG